jgi:putative transposase
MESNSIGHKSATATRESFQYDIINDMQFPEDHWKK